MDARGARLPQAIGAGLVPCDALPRAPTSQRR